MRNCPCGEPLPLETRRGPRRKFCTTCRPPRIKGETTATKRRTEPVLPAPIGGCLDAARAELTEAGAMDTTSGRAILALAARIDSGDETGSALASLVAQLEKSLRPLKVQEVEDDPLQRLLSRSGDELSQRRERRSS